LKIELLLFINQAITVYKIKAAIDILKRVAKSLKVRAKQSKLMESWQTSPMPTVRVN
jgi:hypothetical protein